jgi:hypothetical protein
LIEEFFLAFSTKVPLRFVIYLPKVPKIAIIIGHDVLGHALPYIRVQNLKTVSGSVSEFKTFSDFGGGGGAG